jgi:GNAT superfamily N-acetyltransferase
MQIDIQSVSMVRVGEKPFPQFPLPAGYAIEWYHAGCEEWWYEIQLRSDELTRVTRDLFWQYFGQARAELARRQCYLMDQRHQPIGTATAWFDPDYHGECWGRLHWVAILPQHQGQGLAKPLLSVVCERLRQFHPARSFLRTAPQRLAAIHLYLEFGFVPEIRGPEEAVVWEGIQQRLAAGRTQARPQSSEAV